MNTSTIAWKRMPDVRRYSVMLYRGDDMFIATWQVQHPSGAVQPDDDRWVLAKAVYQRKSRYGLVKRPRSQQRPRMRRIGSFAKLRDCVSFLMRSQNHGGGDVA